MRLQELCSKEGAEEYMEYIRLKNVYLLDLLTESPSCKPPVRLLLEQLPRLQPRPYSRACSPRKDPSIISFVITVVCQPRPGMAASWTAELKEGESVRAFPRTNCDFRANPENQKFLAKSTDVASYGTKFQSETPKYLLNPDNQKYMGDSQGIYLNADAQDIQFMLGSDGGLVNDGGMSRNLDATNQFHSEPIQNASVVESVPSPKVSVIKLAGSNSSSRLGTPLSDLQDI